MRSSFTQGSPQDRGDFFELSSMYLQEKISNDEFEQAKQKYIFDYRLAVETLGKVSREAIEPVKKRQSYKTEPHSTKYKRPVGLGKLFRH